MHNNPINQSINHALTSHIRDSSSLFCGLCLRGSDAGAVHREAYWNARAHDHESQLDTHCAGLANALGGKAIVQRMEIIIKIIIIIIITVKIIVLNIL